MRTLMLEYILKHSVQQSKYIKIMYSLSCNELKEVERCINGMHLIMSDQIMMLLEICRGDEELLTNLPDAVLQGTQLLSSFLHFTINHAFDSETALSFVMCFKLVLFRGEVH